MKKIAIIGGGASGMVAAITAARILKNKCEIVLFERNARLGKKLLSTGNGRCNLSNSEISDKNFQNCGGPLLKKVINACDVKKTLEFFGDCGLKCKVTHGGRIYPYHEQASAVLDVLRFTIGRLDIKLATETKVTEAVRKSKGGFMICGEGRQGKITYDCDKLVMSTGGKAAPKTGSDGNGFELMESLGHRVIAVTPALTQLKTDNRLTNSLSGIKINAGLSAKLGSRVLKRVNGEVMFTAYGLSGSAVFDISGVALANNGDVIIDIDFLPELEFDAVSDILISRRTLLYDLPTEEFFTGFINKRIGQGLSKQIPGLASKRRVSDISDNEIKKLTEMLKKYGVHLKGHTGWDNAQTNFGGLLSEEFYSETLESRMVHGLYASGELFGFAGECGGFNLQWAWSSGIVIGEALVKSI